MSAEPAQAFLPETTQTIRQMIERQAARYGSRPFVRTADGALTYAELDEVANRGANLLLGLGYGSGDVVMARCLNSLPMLATWLGCVKLGAVFMPVNSMLLGESLRSVMSHAAGGVVVCQSPLYSALAEVRNELPALRDVLVAGGDVPSGCVSFDALLERASSSPPPLPPRDPAAPARLMYTSGTTGRPKGVIWSRTAETLHAICYGDELVRVNEGETVYSCLPLFHATCQGTLLGTLWRGGRIAIDIAFDPFRFWSRIRAEGAVFFPYVGTIVSVLGKRPRRADDADNPVRRIMGSAAPADTWRMFEERYALTIEDVWGQTETASCWTRPSSSPAPPGTVGRATERFEARICDENGNEVARGEAGEMWIRPRAAHIVFEGYFRDEGGTAGMWTADGWYRTGDQMRQHDDGDFVFIGRLRDAIRRRGEMIAPVEIEQAALGHPDVLEAAAVATPAPTGVEDEVKLCVVLQPGVELDSAALYRYLKERLPAFMLPRYIGMYAEFPKTPTTRIQKYRLREDGVDGAWDSQSRRRPIRR
ncbi:MAG TPA: AMP-binding protein [Candidatus Dormibacteraeota bacterium]|nr:AMP-binding protein [Candidatus Dormibacteraeota bacterium]